MQPKRPKPSVEAGEQLAPLARAKGVLGPRQPGGDLLWAPAPLVIGDRQGEGGRELQGAHGVPIRELPPLGLEGGAGGLVGVDQADAAWVQAEAVDRADQATHDILARDQGIPGQVEHQDAVLGLQRPPFLARQGPEDVVAAGMAEGQRLAERIGPRGVDHHRPAAHRQVGQVARPAHPLGHEGVGEHAEMARLELVSEGPAPLGGVEEHRAP